MAEKARDQERIGKYQILELLGKGAAGQVYKAKQDQIDRIVALKVLFPNLVAAKPQFVERFEREAKIIARLYHPNIIAVFEIGVQTVDGVPLHYYAMEYVEGTTMDRMMRGSGDANASGATPRLDKQLTFDHKLDMTEQLADALRLAHRQGVVHRDLKPLNVLVDREGTPKILDFGISKTYDDDDLTQAGMIIGSPPYMSPEQARAQEATAKSDIFSFGVMVYELFSGVRPFHATSKKEYILDRAAYPKLPKDKLPKKLTAIDPAFPPVLGDLVFSMLAPRPEDRPTAERLLTQFDQFRKELFHRRVELIMRERGQIAARLPATAWRRPAAASAIAALLGSLLLVLRYVW